MCELLHYTNYTNMNGKLKTYWGCSLFHLSHLSSCPTLDKSPVDQRAHAEKQTIIHTYGQFIVVGQVRAFRVWELATVELYSERANNLSYDLLLLKTAELNYQVVFVIRN